MVLNGLKFSSWQAWLAGVYFVRKPWGVPTPTGYCSHPYVLFALIFNLISYTFWFDCQMKLYPITGKFSLTERILADAVVLLTAVFDLFFRVNFYRFQWDLPDFLNTLEKASKHGHPIHLKQLKCCWKMHRISLKILAVPRYILAVTLVCAYGAITESYPDSAFYLPNRYIYFILFGIFTAVPSVCSIIFAYDLIVITTFHMLWSFEDFCGLLEDHIYKGYFLRKKFAPSLNPTPSMTSLNRLSPAGTENKVAPEIEKHCCGADPDPEKGTSSFERLSFNGFVKRFDWIISLGEKYDKIIGPIILGVVVRCVISIVHAVNAIMVGKKEFHLKNWYHAMLLFTEASQLVILKLGSQVNQRITFWKGKLTKAWLLTNSNAENLQIGHETSSMNLKPPFQDDREDVSIIIDNVEYDNKLVQDLVNYVCAWNWKVSAAGIFDIDTGLLNGIVSTTLTYVIILFQLNMADDDVQGENDPNNNTMPFQDSSVVTAGNVTVVDLIKHGKN